ncbi:hypothetical protein [Sphingorhabdus contaminans]|uniref:Uncharacterized protein n=1 Tax=Sphingorhabdus contaminans TaxID=1343899 RepID=A0A553WB00_9SPHN|nr:hypothetical protein [Sphingorhabdus contaminans]TSB01853.1 hypothetical protein FOM92_11855 [Sphingorhabdus contaminans]
MRRFAATVILAMSLIAAPAFSKDDATQTTGATDPDLVIKCRKVEVTGSLVKKGKVCKTAGEWKRIQRNGNRTARAIVESGNICSGGCCGNGVGCGSGE